MALGALSKADRRFEIERQEEPARLAASHSDVQAGARTQVDVQRADFAAEIEMGMVKPGPTVTAPVARYQQKLQDIVAYAAKTLNR